MIEYINYEDSLFNLKWKVNDTKNEYLGAFESISNLLQIKKLQDTAKFFHTRLGNDRFAFESSVSAFEEQSTRISALRGGRSVSELKDSVKLLETEKKIQKLTSGLTTILFDIIQTLPAGENVFHPAISFRDIGFFARRLRPLCKSFSMVRKMKLATVQQCSVMVTGASIITGVYGAKPHIPKLKILEEFFNDGINVNAKIAMQLCNLAFIYYNQYLNRGLSHDKAIQKPERRLGKYVWFIVRNGKLCNTCPTDFWSGLKPFEAREVWNRLMRKWTHGIKTLNFMRTSTLYHLLKCNKKNLLAAEFEPRRNTPAFTIQDGFKYICQHVNSFPPMEAFDSSFKELVDELLTSVNVISGALKKEADILADKLVQGVKIKKNTARHTLITKCIEEIDNARTADEINTSLLKMKVEFKKTRTKPAPIRAIGNSELKVSINAILETWQTTYDKMHQRKWYSPRTQFA
ncbi:hypothetical protein P0136_11635 [Lentisphaerota bacterium ZTH]|nr:hypothetical protein JYG24_10845 [Lentisphaerota bacterium]WET06008.1 hypothetical protein P0136_11635 [Lentisphaerota bacterium ZTH]